ncbi:MAG: hypothetical protein ACI4DW_09210 [Lachnospiraceae bacterium]
MIKAAEKNEARILAELAIQMWNDNTAPDFEKEFEELTQSDKAGCLKLICEEEYL